MGSLFFNIVSKSKSLRSIFRFLPINTQNKIRNFYYYFKESLITDNFPFKFEKTLYFRNLQEAITRKKDYCVLISHDSSESGAPLLILNIGKILKEKYNFEVFFLLLRGGGIEKDFEKIGTAIELSSYCNPISYNKKIFDKIFQPMDRHKPIFTLVNSASSWQPLESLEKFKPVCLIHEYSDYYQDWIFKKIDKLSHKIIFPANSVRDSFFKISKLKNADPTKTIVLRQSILNKVFLDQNENHKTKITNQLKIPPNSFIIIGCGWGQERKGVDLFVQTAIKTFRKGYLNFYFLWVGEMGNGSYQFWTRLDVKKSGFEKNILFLGHKKNIYEYLKSSDLFFLSSRLDPFPFVVLDAMACSLPVICFEGATGSSEFIYKAKETILPYLDTNLASESIIKLFSDTPKRKKIGMENNIIIKNHYDFKEYVSKIIEFMNFE